MLGANRHQFNPSSGPQQDTRGRRRDGYDFLFSCSCFSVLLHTVKCEAKHLGRNSSFLFFFFFSPRSQQSALIITAPSHSPPPPNWRQRATAGGEEVDFKQYRLQEVQPSLLVVDSDINSNEYLGALPDCLSTWAGKVLFFCASVCAGLHVCTSVYLCIRMHHWDCVCL